MPGRAKLLNQVWVPRSQGVQKLSLSILKEGDVGFTLKLAWHSTADECHYAVELAGNDGLVTSSTTKSPNFRHTFGSQDDVLVDRFVAQIWSVDPSDNEVRSKSSLEFDVPPLPQSMAEYANVIKSKVSSSRSAAVAGKHLTSYAFNLEVLNLIKSEMMTMLKDIQEATSISDEVDTMLLESQETTEPVIDIE